MQLILFLWYFCASFESRLGTASPEIWFPRGIMFITRYLRCFFFSSVSLPPPPPLSSDLSSACEDHKSVYPHSTPTHPAHSALALYHASTWHLFILFGTSDWHHFLEQVTTLRENMTTIDLTGKSVNTEARTSTRKKAHELIANLSKRDWDTPVWPWGHNLNHLLCTLNVSPHVHHFHTSCWLLLIYSFHPPWDSYPMKMVTPTLATRLKTMTADRTGSSRAFTCGAAVSSSWGSWWSVGTGRWVVFGKDSTAEKNYERIRVLWKGTISDDVFFWNSI